MMITMMDDLTSARNPCVRGKPKDRAVLLAQDCPARFPGWTLSWWQQRVSRYFNFQKKKLTLIVVEEDEEGADQEHVFIFRCTTSPDYYQLQQFLMILKELLVPSYFNRVIWCGAKSLEYLEIHLTAPDENEDLSNLRQSAEEWLWDRCASTFTFSSSFSIQQHTNSTHWSRKWWEVLWVRVVDLGFCNRRHKNHFPSIATAWPHQLTAAGKVWRSPKKGIFQRKVLRPAKPI